MMMSSDERSSGRASARSRSSSNSTESMSFKGGLFLCFRKQESVANGGSTPRLQGQARGKPAAPAPAPAVALTPCSPSGSSPSIKSPPKWRDCPAYESEALRNAQPGVVNTSSEDALVTGKNDEPCCLQDSQDCSTRDSSPSKNKREHADRAELLSTIKRLRRAAQSQEELLATRSNQLYAKQQEVEQLAARLAAAEQHSQQLQEQLYATTPRKHSTEPPPAPATPPAGRAMPATPTSAGNPPETPQTPKTPLRALESSLSQLQHLNAQLTHCSQLTPNPVVHLDDSTTPSTPPASPPTVPAPSDPHIHNLLAVLDAQVRQHAQLLKSLLPAAPSAAATDKLPPADHDPQLRPGLGSSTAAGGSAAAAAGTSHKAAVDAAAVAATASVALRQRDQEIGQLEQVRKDLEEELALERRRSELLQQQVARLQGERAEKGPAACQVLEEELQEYRAMVDHLEAEQAQQARLLKDMAAKFHSAEASVRQLKAEVFKATVAEESLKQEVANLNVQLEQQQQQQQAAARGKAADSLASHAPSLSQQQEHGAGSEAGLVEGVDLQASVLKLVSQKVALEVQLRDSQEEIKLLRNQLAAVVARNREEYRTWLAQTSDSMQQLNAELRTSFSNDRRRSIASAAELRRSFSGATSTPSKAPPPSSSSPWGSSTNSLKPPTPSTSPAPALVNRQSKSSLSKSTGKLAFSPFKQPPWRATPLTSKQRASTSSVPSSKPSGWH